jgi:hypothetical protein
MVLLYDFDRCGIRDLRILRYLHTAYEVCCLGLDSLCERSDARLLAILQHKELKSVRCVHDEFRGVYEVSADASVGGLHQSKKASVK